MVRLPDGRDGVVRELAGLLVALVVSGHQLPEAGTEVGACQHGVGDEPDQDDDERHVRERHEPCSSGNGAAASRRSTHQTATPRPRYTTASAP